MRSRPEPYLSHAGSVISLEATAYFARCGFDFTQTLSVQVFSVCAHASDGDDLLIFLYALVELSEEDAEA